MYHTVFQLPKSIERRHHKSQGTPGENLKARIDPQAAWQSGKGSEINEALPTTHTWYRHPAQDQCRAHMGWTLEGEELCPHETTDRQRTPAMLGTGKFLGEGYHVSTGIRTRPHDRGNIRGEVRADIDARNDRAS